MDEFIRNLSSPSWWIGVVLFGIIINLASDYLKSRLDKYLSQTFRWWSNRSAKRKAERQKTLEQLRNNPHEQLMFSVQELRSRLRSLVFMVIAIFCYFSALNTVSIARIGFFAVAAISIFLTLADYVWATDINSLLDESRNKNVDDKKNRQ